MTLELFLCKETETLKHRWKNDIKEVLINRGCILLSESDWFGITLSVGVVPEDSGISHSFRAGSLVGL